MLHSNLFPSFRRRFRKLIATTYRRKFPKKLSHRNINLSSKIDFSLKEISIKLNLSFSSLCHVGAHKGQEVESYLEIGVKEAVLIEPIAANFEILKERIRDIVKFSAVQVAAGEMQSISRIRLASNDYQSSSLLEPLLHLEEAPTVQFDETELVSVERLDDILSVEFKPEILIVDVQGFELNVLRGAKRVLSTTQYLLLEVNRDEVYLNCAKVWELDEYLLDFGFSRVITRWWDSWGDALYLRR